MAGACALRQNILGEDLKFEACFGFKRRRRGGLGGNLSCLWTTRPGFESRHGASPQCSLREAADRTVNTVQIKYKYPRPRRRIQERGVAWVGVMSWACGGFFSGEWRAIRKKRWSSFQMFSKFRWIRYEPGQVENGEVIYRIASHGWKLEIPVPVKS